MTRFENMIAFIITFFIAIVIGLISAGKGNIMDTLTTIIIMNSIIFVYVNWLEIDSLKKNKKEEENESDDEKEKEQK